MNPANDVAIDNYRIGMPRPVVAPVVPSPSASAETKVEKITNAASTALQVTHKALIVSMTALIAAASGSRSA